jgi:hypothetical protein
MEITQLTDAAKITSIISKNTGYRNSAADRKNLDGTNRESHVSRSPLIITSTNWSTQSPGRYIVFWAGPKEANWKFQLRGVEQQTRSGWIQHYWRDDKRSTFFDNPTIDFTFQSGNLVPVRLVSGVSANQAKVVTLPPGLLDCYDFFELLDDKKILSNGQSNLIYIVYHSLVFPSITLYGYFNPEGVSIQESAETPDQLTWTAQFRVQGSSPRFYKKNDLVSTWNEQFSKL